MFLLFSKQHKARKLDLITLEIMHRRVFSKLSSFRQQQQKERRFTVPDHFWFLYFGPRPFSVSLFRSQTIFGLGDALSLVARNRGKVMPVSVELFLYWVQRP